jgi:type IV pilus assembly protein PilB
MNAPIALSGLARRLVNDGVITADAAQEAVITAKKDRTPLTKYLAEKNLATPRVIALAAMEEFGTPLLDLSAIRADALPKDIIDKKLVQKYQVLPLFKRGNRLFIAMTDPTNLQALDDIKFATSLNTDAVLVEQNTLDLYIDKFLAGEEEKLDLGEDGDVDLEGIDISVVDEGGEPKGDAEGSDDAPIVKFINKILLDAIKGGASDIHVEPYEKICRIRLRTDGILQEVSRPPVNLAGRLAARLKVMSRMDISERRVPQDGRIKMKISKNKAIDFRVNTLPTLWGEKVVLRILDPSSAKMGIDALGYEDFQKQMYLQVLAQPQGMILVTGPTGSGKTVSLYTGLNILNTEERNISTAEDPVEINLEGINQVNVNPRVGLDFTEALRAFLRQDPDVIMVGEIRDIKTAEIAIKAAQTGHLVLSTLHTNSAPETLTRLANMGVPAFNIATTVTLIIAQRLARRLCPACKRPATDVPDEILKKEGLLDCGIKREEVQLFHPTGCPACKGGYKGRVGIYEVVKITDNISRIIMENGNAIQIADACKKEGFFNLRTAALRKAAWGLTSLEEVNRVTKD